MLKPVGGIYILFKAHVLTKKFSCLKEMLEQVLDIKIRNAQ